MRNGCRYEYGRERVEIIPIPEDGMVQDNVNPYMEFDDQ